MGTVKDEARKLIDSLPEHATWDDVMYEFYVKKKLGQALKEAAEGEVISHEKAQEAACSHRSLRKSSSVNPARFT